jgi:hypothetical protein
MLSSDHIVRAVAAAVIVRPMMPASFRAGIMIESFITTSQIILHGIVGYHNALTIGILMIEAQPRSRFQLCGDLQLA